MGDKRNFLKGLLMGILCTTLVLAVTFITLKPNINFDGVLDNKADTADAAENNSNAENDKIIQKINLLKEMIDKYFLEDVEDKDLATGIYKGLISSLEDPYSAYYTQEEYKAVLASSSGTYSGIGVTVSQNPSTGIITVVKPFKEGPGYEAGLLPGDIIYKVNGEEVTGLDISEVVSQIKGLEGTEVEISVVREGESEPVVFTVKREKIEVPTIEYEMLDNNIGYILVSEFDEVTLEQFKNAVKELEKQKQTGMIIDLRNNPGGLLDVVVGMLDYILPDGMIVYTEDKNGKREEFKSKDKNEFKKPLVVLINENSASASEIFAGAVKDYKVGTLVGKTSFGKGIVQRILKLNDGTALKLTISKYFTPNGNNIHKIGIVPDIEVDLSDDLKKKAILEKSEDTQLQKAIEVIKGK